MGEGASNFRQTHSRNIAASGLAGILCIVMELLNRGLLQWVDLYASMRTAATILTAVVALAALFPWQSGRYLRWAGFAVALGAFAAFVLLGHVLEGPGYASLDRNGWAKALPLLYAFVFGAPAWSLKGLAIGTVKPGGLTMGNQEVLPPAEGLHVVNVPANAVFNIVFLHGIHGDYVTTWSKDEEKASYWPDWISKEFRNAAVYSAQYNAFVTKWKGGTMPLYDRATSVLNMCDNKRLFLRPTVFVVHSYGGLVLKQMWRLALDRLREDVRQSVRGVIFLATPHSGSTLSNFLPFIRSFARATVTADELRHADSDLRDLNIWYRNHPVSHNFVYYETQPTPPLNLKVVDESSADPGMQGLYPVPIFADHISLCKPDRPHCEVDDSVRRNISDIMVAAPPRRISRTPGGSGLEIEITREVGGQLSTFAVQLNDLLIAPHGIATLVDEYAKDPTNEKWKAVQQRANENRSKFHDLLEALDALKEMPFFGNFYVEYGDIANATERLIDAKMHNFYNELEGYPSRPQADSAVLARLTQKARNLEGFNGPVREIQAALSAYLEKNAAYLRTQLAVKVRG